MYRAGLFPGGKTWEWTKMDATDLREHILMVLKIVETWPAWKRNILNHSLEPNNSEARVPVDNGPSKEWLLKMGELEDGCPSVCAGSPDPERLKALEELATEAQDLGLGYD